MTWRLATAIKTLQAEVNAAHPDRPKQADGTIGDARHQAEVSDHNPVAPHPGVVTAWDITTAPFTIALAEKLRQMGRAGDERVKYVIYRGRITSAEHGWEWVPYSGYSQHYDHIHLSVADSPSQYDRTDRWGVFDPPVTAHTVSSPSPLGDRMLFLLSYNGKHYITDGFRKRLVTPSFEKALTAAGVKYLALTSADAAALPGSE